MAGCAWCGELILIGGTKVNDAQFCNDNCAESLRRVEASPNFCPACLSDTSDKSTGNVFRFNGIGTWLLDCEESCPTCGSDIQRLFFCFLFIPVIPLGKFRVKQQPGARIISRKLLR